MANGEEQKATGTKNTDEQIAYFTSHAEILAHALGALQVLALLEQEAVNESKLQELEKAGLVDLSTTASSIDSFRKIFIKAFVTLHERKSEAGIDFDRLVTAYAPDEPLFEKHIKERLDEGEHDCITKTFNALLRLRAKRGSFLLEPFLGGKPLPEYALGKGSDKVHFPSIVNLGQLIGICNVLSTVETYRDFGSVPRDAYAQIVFAVDKDTKLGEYLNVFLPTSNMVEGGKTAGFTRPLLERARLEEHCFITTNNRLLDAYSELFPTLASSFVEEHFEIYACSRAKGAVQKILNNLQGALEARFRMVQQGTYDQVADIDKHSAHLYETLKQYGIHATTYPEARDQAERLYKEPEPSRPPRDIQSTINERINEIRNKAKTHVLTLASLSELKATVPKEYPGQETFIEWEIDKIINDFRRGKL